MPTSGGCSEMGCVCGHCYADAKERQRLAAMTFHQRKAERIAKRQEGAK